MKTLDRYVIRNFLYSAILWFIVLMSLRIVADLFINMDEYAKLDISFHEKVQQICSYYSYQSLMYFTELGGIIIVASAAFSLARMNHTNELTAMLASGVSLHRVIWPITICAALMCGLIVADQELVIPRVADKLVRSRDEVPGTRQFTLYLVMDGNGGVWYTRTFKPSEELMESPVLIVRDDHYRPLASISGRQALAGTLGKEKGWMVFDAAFLRINTRGEAWPNLPDVKKVWTHVGPQKLLELAAARYKQDHTQDLPPDFSGTVFDVQARDNHYGLTIEAERFMPDPPAEDQPRGGRLENPRFTFRTEDGTLLGTFLAQSARWNGERIEGRWELTGGALFRPSDLTTEYLLLRQSGRWLSLMSTKDLTDLLKLNRVPDRQMASLTRNLRFTDPLNNLVMLLLGLPFILSRERAIKASATLCLLIVGAFYLFIYVCRYTGLPPEWSAWLPILVFGPIAVVMVDAVKT